MNYIKNIKVSYGVLIYTNPNILKITNQYLKLKSIQATNKFLNCQTKKCKTERNNYIKKIVKILSSNKISVSERKKEIQRLVATPEYKKSVQCIIKKCNDVYMKSVQLNENAMETNKKYFNDLIKEYKKTISTLTKTKMDNKLLEQFHKSNKTELNALTLKDIKKNHKDFIKGFKIGLKYTIEQQKYNTLYYQKLKKFIPIYKQLLKEGKKEEYIYHKTFEPYLFGLM